VVQNVGLEKVVEAAQVVVVSDQQHLGPPSSSLQFFSKKTSVEKISSLLLYFTQIDIERNNLSRISQKFSRYSDEIMYYDGINGFFDGTR
jgi:hypothetical protein